MPDHYDVMFTSPPYFATELYNKGGVHEQDQSWSRYATYEEWRDGFLMPVMKGVYDCLKPGGHIFLNMMDPKIKGKRYYAGADFVNAMLKLPDCKFQGLIGMRIMQRPKSLKSFENGKAGLDEFMTQWYIEPIYVLSKGEVDVQYFPKQNTLEDFFG